MSLTSQKVDNIVALRENLTEHLVSLHEAQTQNPLIKDDWEWSRDVKRTQVNIKRCDDWLSDKD